MPEREAEEGALGQPQLLLHLLAGLTFRERITGGERHSLGEEVDHGESTHPVEESALVDVSHDGVDRAETDGRLGRAPRSRTASLR